MGLAVPGDVAVVGFDGLPELVAGGESRTTVYTPWRDVAHAAVSVLVSQIAGETVPRKTVVPVVLEAGATS
jgi:DNA-binding LacI/PurR family transcriptional regulator